MRTTIFLLVSWLAFGLDIHAQESLGFSRTIPLWEGHSDRGALLVSPKEMIVIDSKGKKLGMISASDPITGVWVSPSGKKVLYTTATAIWLSDLDSGKSALVKNGACEFIKWNADALGFLFAIQGTFFWADGNGENIKQVYP